MLKLRSLGQVDPREREARACDSLKREAMRHFGWAVAFVVAGAVAAACGGARKPPMVPDAPDPALADGGADTPAAPATAPPAAKK